MVFNIHVNLKSPFDTTVYYSEIIVYLNNSTHRKQTDKRPCCHMPKYLGHKSYRMSS